MFQEWNLRCDLAALYRIFNILSWDDAIFTHISARIPGTDYILMNPYGFLYDEITASSLIKVNLHNIQDVSTSESILNKVGFNIHSALHLARPEVKFIIHSHSSPIVAVSSLESGISSNNQYSIYITNNIGYHGYNGIFFWEDEKKLLVENIKNFNFLLMKNHGSLVLGKNLETAFFHQYILQRACEVQILIESNKNKISNIDPSCISRTIEFTKKFQLEEDRAPPLLWKAMLRKLNKINPGYDI